MTKKKLITHLTKAQEARFPEFVKKWIDIGLSTEPADRPKAERAIRGLYALAKLKEPRVIWLPCPISAALSSVVYASLIQKRLVALDESAGAAVVSAVVSAVNSAVNSAVYSAVYSAVDSAVDGAVGSAVYSAVDSAVDGAVGSAVNSAVVSAVVSAVNSAVDSAVNSAVHGAVYSAGRSYYGGSLWSGYSAYADYFNEVCGVKIDRHYLDSIESCGFFWMLDSLCFASERPTHIRRDEQGRLHSAIGQSIGYGSGWGLWHWHGVKVPQEWIEKPGDIDPRTALIHENIEQRTALAQIIGWEKILAQLSPKVIDKDTDESIGELLEVDLPESPKTRFLRVVGPGAHGPRGTYVLGVPREMKTALEANCWTQGETLETYNLIKRT